MECVQLLLLVNYSTSSQAMGLEGGRKLFCTAITILTKTTTNSCIVQYLVCILMREHTKICLFFLVVGLYHTGFCQLRWAVSFLQLRL